MDDDLTSVVANIRACIVSCKGPIPLRNLNRDYDTLVGEAIPFRKFGHNTLESFLLSVPSLRLCGTGRDAMVEAAASDASKHVSALIAKQKSNRRTSQPPPRRPYPPSRGRGAARGRGTRGHPPRHSLQRDYPYPRNVPQRYSPTNRREYETDYAESLTVKVDGAGDKRQVSIADPHALKKPSSTSDLKLSRYELPPRLQRKKEILSPGPLSPSGTVTHMSQNFEERLTLDHAEESSIISPFSPSQLVAAGRKKLEQEEAIFQYMGQPLVPAEPFTLDMATNALRPVNLRHFDNGLHQFDGASSIQPLVLENSTGEDLEPDDINIENNINLLHQYTRIQGWPDPEYNVLCRTPQYSAPLYCATVKITRPNQDSLKFNSSPHEDESREVAKGYAARKALEDLNRKEKVKAKIISSDSNVICDRITSIVSGVFNGMFAKNLEEVYIENYNECLPSNWINTVSFCPTLSVEFTPNSTIILPKDPTVQLTSPSSQSNLMYDPPSLNIDQLTEEILYVYITHATSTTNVWFRIIGNEYSAVNCILDGLENFCDDDIACGVVSKSPDLIGRELIAKISCKDEGFLKVILYDTSGDDDVNVNDQIRDSIIVAKADFFLPSEGHAMEVYIGDISKKGEVYVQKPGPAYEHIVEVLNSLTPEQISEHKLTSFKQVKQNKLYLAKYSKDDNWYRAEITAPPSVQQNKIAVRFIDFGNAETIGISDMALLENLNPLLNKLPPQAKKVALNNLPIEILTTKDVAKLHSLLLDEEKVVLIKTTNLQSNPPEVEVFYKNEEDNAALVSVNTTIELQRNISRKEEKKIVPSGPVNHKQLVVTRKAEHSLKFPELSKEFEVVLIVLAANPGNFVFQPMKYGKQFKILTGQMCAYYDGADLPELSNDQIVVGQLYAGLYEDGRWYRMVVTSSVLGNKVPVRLCDYGDMTCLNVSNLRLLDPAFLDFPFMAVNGRLHGVAPVHGDWSVEDCIRFQNLVVEKVLAAEVRNIKENNSDAMEMVASLKLTDTTNQEDIIIADVLINEGRAKKTED